MNYQKRANSNDFLALVTLALTKFDLVLLWAWNSLSHPLLSLPFHRSFSFIGAAALCTLFVCCFLFVCSHSFLRAHKQAISLIFAYLDFALIHFFFFFIIIVFYTFLLPICVHSKYSQSRNMLFHFENVIWYFSQLTFLFSFSFFLVLLFFCISPILLFSLLTVIKSECYDNAKQIPDRHQLA